MYTDKFNFKGDHSSVAEELFSEVTSQEEKYLAVEESVAEGYFTLHEALEAYKVEEIEYLAFLITRLKTELQNESVQIKAFKAISTVIRVFDYPIKNVFNTTEKAAINKIQVLAQGSVQRSTTFSKVAKVNINAKATLGSKVAKVSKGNVISRRKKA
jgi:hypothetical protein